MKNTLEIVPSQVFYTINNMLYLTASFNSFPGLKAGTLEAAISISSPVCGLRPFELHVHELQTYQSQLIGSSLL